VSAKHVKQGLGTGVIIIEGRRRRRRRR